MLKKFVTGTIDFKKRLFGLADSITLWCIVPILTSCFIYSSNSEWCKFLLLCQMPKIVARFDL